MTMNWKGTVRQQPGIGWFTTMKIEHEQYDPGPFMFDSKLSETLASLEAIRDDIPEEYRATAMCEFNANYRHESGYVTIEVSYIRPATVAEIDTALNGIGQREHAARQREIEQLRALKAKYPDVN